MSTRAMARAHADERARTGRARPPFERPGAANNPDATAEAPIEPHSAPSRTATAPARDEPTAPPDTGGVEAPSPSTPTTPETVETTLPTTPDMPTIQSTGGVEGPPPGQPRHAAARERRDRGAVGDDAAPA